MENKNITAQEAHKLSIEGANAIEQKNISDDFWERVHAACKEGRQDFSTFRLNGTQEEIYRELAESNGYSISVYKHSRFGTTIHVSWSGANK